MRTWKQLITKLAPLAVISVLLLSLLGCGKGQDEPGKNETPEMQKQRKEKSGD
jgi:hypothetical protein